MGRGAAEENPPRLRQWQGLAGPGTVGLEVVLSILFGFGAGWWLDGKLGTGPYLQIVGFLFGVAAGGKAIWRSWKQMQLETAREEREQGNPPPLLDPDEVKEEKERASEEEAEPTKKENDGAGS